MVMYLNIVFIIIFLLRSFKTTVFYTHIVHYLFKILSSCCKDCLIKSISLNQPIAPFKWNCLIYFLFFWCSVFVYNSNYGPNF